MAKQVKKVAGPAADGAAPAAASAQAPVDPETPSNITKIAKPEGPIEPEAAPEPETEAPAPPPPAAASGPTGGNPPLHMLNRQQWDHDAERREQDPFDGLHEVLGRRATQKLLRRLSPDEAKAEQARAAANPRRFRRDR